MAVTNNIDVERDDLITIADVQEILQHTCSHTAVKRWMVNGVRGIKLDAVRVGARYYTSRSALTQFIHNRKTSVSTREASHKAKSLGLL